MDSDDTIAGRYTRRAKDAADMAVRQGADPAAVLAAVEEGIRDGQRAVERLAYASHPTGPRPEPARPKFMPKPGSAIDRFLKAVG